jgi:hypothetical protein
MSRVKHRREKMRQFSRGFTKGGEYSVLVFGLLGCLAGTLVTFFADDTAYAGMLVLLGLFVGAALWKREAA